MARKIGLSMRVSSSQGYDEKRDCLAQDWPAFLQAAIPEASWLFIPNLGKSVIDFVTDWNLDGFILTGGNDIGDSPIRDETESELLRIALERKIPVLGVCRGLQLIQHFFGGKIAECSPETHMATTHKIRLLPGLSLITETGEREVNSYHRYAPYVNQIAAPLAPFAVASDGVVEGLFHREAKIVATQWHPERTSPFSKEDIRLVRDALALEGS